MFILRLLTIRFAIGSFLLGSVVYAGPAPANNSPAAAMQASLQKQRESLQKQRDSFRRQPGMKQGFLLSSTNFIDPLPPLIEAECPALSANEVDSLISEAAQKQSVDPALIRAVMRQESGFHPCAVSIKGAQGLMQLMPATAAQFQVSDAFDPKQNVTAGTALLKQLLDRYKGDVRLTLVAYNAGANRADDKSGQPYPVETQHYLANILGELGIGPPDSSAQPIEPLTPPDDSSSDAPAPASQAPETSIPSSIQSATHSPEPVPATADVKTPPQH